MMVDSEWLVERIDAWLSYLDKLPHRTPANDADKQLYAAGLIDMAEHIREGIMQEGDWQGLREFLGDAAPASLPKHGWGAVDSTPDIPNIVCPQCGARSYHPQDVSERYCGHCHQFHAEMRVGSTPKESL
jgi:hypothetical protein